MTQLLSVPEPGPGHKPGSYRSNPAQCRPRQSAADLRIHEIPAEIDPDSPSRKAIDHIAVRFRDDPTDKKMINYYRRRRHVFGWPPYRNAPPI